MTAFGSALPLELLTNTLASASQLSPTEAMPTSQATPTTLSSLEIFTSTVTLSPSSSASQLSMPVMSTQVWTPRSVCDGATTADTTSTCTRPSALASRGWSPRVCAATGLTATTAMQANRNRETREPEIEIIECRPVVRFVFDMLADGFCRRWRPGQESNLRPAA